MCAETQILDGVPSGHAGGTLVHDCLDTSGVTVCSVPALMFHFLLSCMFNLRREGELKDVILSVNQVD